MIRESDSRRYVGEYLSVNIGMFVFRYTRKRPIRIIRPCALRWGRPSGSRYAKTESRALAKEPGAPVFRVRNPRDRSHISPAPPHPRALWYAQIASRRDRVVRGGSAGRSLRISNWVSPNSYISAARDEFRDIPFESRCYPVNGKYVTRRLSFDIMAQM